MARADYKILIYLFAATLIFSSCKEKSIDPNTPTKTAAGDVLVINEGNFNWGNASLSLYNPNNKTIQHKVYESANGRGLGDVAQSAVLINGDWWVVVNNSGKIEVLDSSNFKIKQTITGFNSPRNICLLNEKVYITDLYTNEISIVNAISFQKEGNILLTGWTEEIVAQDTKLYALNKDSNAIYESNAGLSGFTKMVLEGSPVHLQQTGQGVLVALRTANAMMIKDLKNSKSYSFPNLRNSTNLSFDQSGNSAFAIADNNLYFIDLQTESSQIIKDLTGKNIYGLSSINGKAYLSDAKDYILKSDIFIYDNTGNLVDQQEGGVITSGFVAANK